jgi:hypothetical protein
MLFFCLVLRGGEEMGKKRAKEKQDKGKKR